MNGIYEKYKKQSYLTLVCATLANIAIGFQFTWSLIGKKLMAEYGFNASQATLPYTLMAFVSGETAWLTGLIGKKFGPKVCIAMSGIIMGGGMILASITRNPVIIAIFAGAFFGFASVCVTSNSNPSVIQWFPVKMKGTVTGICNCGMAVVSLIFSPAINKLLAAVGVAKSLRYIGIALLVVMPIISMGFKKPPQEIVDAVAQEGKEQMVERQSRQFKVWYPNADAKFSLKKIITWQMWIMYGFSMMEGKMFTSQAANIITVEAGVAATANVVAVLALGNLLGRFFAPMISDRIGVFNVYKIINIIQISNMLLWATVYRSAGIMVFACFLVGLCQGACVPTIFSMCSQVYGKASLNIIFGIVTTSTGIMGLFNTQLAARIFDATGSYKTAFFVSGMFALASLICNFLVRIPKDESDLVEQKTVNA